MYSSEGPLTLRPRSLSLALPLLLGALSACSTSDDPSEPNASGSGGGGGAATASLEEWSTLVEGEWSLPAGEEGYVCVRATVKEDTFIRGFGAIAPEGTHHTLLTFEQSSDKPEETFDCSAAINGPNMLFGSGVGTEDIVFPEGVAIKLEAGDQLLLNLHLYNTRTETLDGLSGIRALRTTEAEVAYEAENMLVGKIAGLTVPPGITSQAGGCVMEHDVTIFAAAPHMHQLGSHLKATAEPVDGTTTVLFDAPYSFEEQIYYPQDPPVTLAAGDRVGVECTYTNEGTETVTFGDSSDAEMCFTGIYRYPKGDRANFICTEDGGGTTFNAPACVEEGDPGNELGVGRHCTAGGNECGSLLCLADLLTADFANFCTMPCGDDSACGAGASCRASSSGSGCMPDACTFGAPDAGG